MTRPAAEAAHAGGAEAEHAGGGRLRWRQAGVTAYRRALNAAALAAVYAAYTVVRNELGSARVPYSVAVGHARALLRVERALHLDVEASLQQLVLGARWLVRAANLYYRWPHLWAVIAMLAYLLAKRSSHYRTLRAALVATTLAALAGFALWPAAPPRLLPGLGFVDTVRRPPWRWAMPPDVSRWRFDAMATNQFAAMPSVHVAFATWVVLAAWQACGPAGRALAAAHLAATWFAVVVTANHWILDGVAGTALPLGAWALVRAAGRLAARGGCLPTLEPAR